MNHFLLFLAVGSEDYLNETMYSLLSFYKFNSDANIKVVVYTDSPEYFNKITASNFSLKTISKDTLNNWKGPDNYIYRSKIKLLQDFSQTQTGNFLFVDSDTVFRKNILHLFEKIEQNTLFLDKCEGSLKDKQDGIAKKTRATFRKQNTYKINNIETIIFDNNYTIWNSGTIGLNSNHTHLLDLTEELLDQMYRVNRLFTVEQLALGYFFQQTNRLEASENYIHHYWYFKEFRSILNHFFSTFKHKSFDELQLEIGKIDPEVLAKPKVAYREKTFFQKTMQKLLHGYKWKLPNYQLP